MRRTTTTGNVASGATGVIPIIGNIDVPDNHHAVVFQLALSSTGSAEFTIRDIDTGDLLSNVYRIATDAKTQTIFLPQGANPWHIGYKGKGIEILTENTGASTFTLSAHIGYTTLLDQVLEKTETLP